MPLQPKKVNNVNTFLNFPPLPEVPSDAGEELKAWRVELQVWYEDLTRLLQRDRDETLAKIKELS